MIRQTSRLLAVLFVLLSPVSAFAFGKNKIVYDDFKWQIYQSTHFEIYFYEEERASLQKVVNFSESAYDELSRKFNFQISKRIPLIFYATHSAFEQTNVIFNFIPEGVGAFAEPVRNRMVLPIDLPDEKVYALIKHELTHIFEYEILFRGRYDLAVRSRPPTWFMEGLASYMAEDEDTHDRMVLRDAVVNDLIPSVKSGFGGFFAYRFGHAVFKFIELEWGEEGVRDFVMEYRNALGPSVDRALKRAFNLTPEEFDRKFRTWLRKRFLPTLIEKGEPQEYGEPFRVQEGVRSTETSPAISPSGDLVVALTTYKQDIDVALFNVPKRELVRNLTKGLPEKYEYIIGQFLTTGPLMGRDLAFSPDGDQIAFFAKKERGRHLVLVNAVTAKLERSVEMSVEQQLNPAFSPDGKKIAFHGFLGNKADIFMYDLESGETTNVTNDDFFDASPSFSPDGRWLIYSSVVDGFSKIFRLDLTDPKVRFKVTEGEWNDIDAVYAPDGRRIFFSSDRQTGRNEPVKAAAAVPGAEAPTVEEPKIDPTVFAAYNIYSKDLESGEVWQYTDVVGGSTVPQVFIGEKGVEKLVFSSYYRGRNSLYITDTAKPFKVVAAEVLPSAPLLESDRGAFVPPVEVAIDEENIRDEGKFRLFVDDVSVNAGFTDDQTFVSRSIITMSDMLGGRRFIASLDSVSTFANFDFIYLDARKRTNWGVRLFDENEYYAYVDETGDVVRDEETYSTTGIIGFMSYPIDRNRRVEWGGGYISRSISYPVLVPGGVEFIKFSDDFPIVFAGFSGDNTHFRSFGPISGRRYNIITQYAYDTEDGGTTSADIIVDFRNYRQLTTRSLLASRIWGAFSDGNNPNFYYFGGLNTLRGFEYNSLVGSRAFYANFELRFPLVDRIDTPLNLNFSNIRAHLFFDVGGAYFEEQEDWKFWSDGQLQNGKAAVGWGIAFNFLGLELHWDWAKRTNLDTLEDDTVRTFWIGQTF
ncbi:MAG: BamA/TamA family outer membrane protein [Thermoanaerobaculia bacterium]|nr:BamA/TamA family outer membrane protein [Thermoanaerobaculia bacterium]